jgi:hypothetical protein
MRSGIRISLPGSILAVLQRPFRKFAKTFNVGRTDQSYRISELAPIVEQTVPGCKIEDSPGGSPDKRCDRVSCEKIRREVPSFRAMWTARQGAQELFDAYKVIGLNKKDLQHGKYARMAQIQRLLKADRVDNSLRWAVARCWKEFSLTFQFRPQVCAGVAFA